MNDDGPWMQVKQNECTRSGAFEKGSFVRWIMSSKKTRRPPPGRDPSLAAFHTNRLWLRKEMRSTMKDPRNLAVEAYQCLEIHEINMYHNDMVVHRQEPPACTGNDCEAEEEQGQEDEALQSKKGKKKSKK